MRIDCITRVELYALIDDILYQPAGTPLTGKDLEPLLPREKDNQKRQDDGEGDQHRQDDHGHVYTTASLRTTRQYEWYCRDERDEKLCLFMCDTIKGTTELVINEIRFQLIR